MIVGRLGRVRVVLFLLAFIPSLAKAAAVDEELIESKAEFLSSRLRVLQFL